MSMARPCMSMAAWPGFNKEHFAFDRTVKRKRRVLLQRDKNKMRFHHNTSCSGTLTMNPISPSLFCRRFWAQLSACPLKTCPQKI